MQQSIYHPWNIPEAEALKLQNNLASKIIKEDQFDDIKLVAGVDVAYSKESNRMIGAVVILDARTLGVIESVTAEDNCQFPYIPGLFSFRELPALSKAFSKLQQVPDLIICDGQGYAHPRRFGLACHLGLLFDTPTIGCGKTRLIGEANELGKNRGSISPLFDNREVIGNVLRTQTDVNPIYISIGHRISLETATDWILRLSPKYRLPETTRQADQLVNRTLK